jgi:hypothetical protein
MTPQLLVEFFQLIVALINAESTDAANITSLKAAVATLQAQAVTSDPINDPSVVSVVNQLVSAAAAATPPPTPAPTVVPAPTSAS